MASNLLLAIASNLEAMACKLLAMVSNLLAMASNRLQPTSDLQPNSNPIFARAASKKAKHKRIQSDIPCLRGLEPIQHHDLKEQMTVLNMCEIEKNRDKK